MKLNHTQITKYIFWPLEVLVVVLIIVKGYLIFSSTLDYSIYYSYGMILGLIAFGLFTIVMLPGMLTRFGIQGKLIQILMQYRREFGKLTFLFALAHYFTIKLFPTIKLNLPLDFPFYQILGFTALTLLLPLFLTSTNWAQKKLGIWWKRLHSLVYIIVWIVFLHVALVQGITLVSVVIFAIAGTELMSILNYYLIRLNLN